jgi:hypothetical protein
VSLLPRIHSPGNRRRRRGPAPARAASAGGRRPATEKPGTRKRPDPACCGVRPSRPSSGAAGNRTRVRLPVPRDVYVRIPPFCSPRSLIGRWTAHHEPAAEVSPAPSRRRTQASQNLSTLVDPPQAGLINEREVRNLKRFYLRSQGEVIVRSYKFPGGLTRYSESLGTQSRLHDTRRSQVSPIPIFSIDMTNLTPPGLRVNPLAAQRLRLCARQRSLRAYARGWKLRCVWAR